MEIYTHTMTAWTPALGLPISGHQCAAVRALGADVAATQGGVTVVARHKGDFPGTSAWRPPMS